MEAFDTYSHAIAALALWSILVMVLAALSTVGRTEQDRSASGKPKRNYANAWYRRERAFANAVESSGPFIAATVAAMLAGAAPFWVNLLASLFILARFFMAIVHIRTENQPLRSAGFTVGLICVAAMAVMALVAAIS